jgi:leucyl/phenylalanyl-tRNA--protein transferase
MTTIRPLTSGRAWDLPCPEECPGDRPAFVGADLEPETLVAAFERGFYPWPPMGERWLRWHEDEWGDDLAAGRIPALGLARPDFTLPWWSPDPRAVLAPDRVHVGRTLGRAAHRSGWTSTLDECPEAVIRRCGVERGTPTWITERLTASFCELARRGVVHSVEVWDGPELVGGCFGILVGGALTVESDFFVRSRAGALSVVDAAARLAQAGGAFLDLHMLSGHSASLGAEEVSRRSYYAAFERCREHVLALPAEQLTVARLARLRAPTTP